MIDWRRPVVVARRSKSIYVSIAVLAIGSSIPATLRAATAPQRFQQGLAYERLGRLDQAYTELQLASNLDPDNAQIALALGILALRLSQWDEAQRALEKSITLDAASAGSYFELALLYEKKGMREPASENWHRFLQLNPDPRLHELAQKHIQVLDAP